MIKNLVNPKLVSMLGKSVFEGYRLSQSIKSAHEIFSLPTGVEAVPYIRRGAIDFCINRNAKKFDNLKSEFCLNKSGNSYHLELCIEDRIIITINHLAHINGTLQTLPRPAVFRELLAQNNPDQFALFELSDKDLGTGKISTILVHTGNESPKAIALIATNPEHTKVLDTLPITLSEQEKDIDTNVIEELTPEFKKFASENFKQGS